MPCLVNLVDLVSGNAADPYGNWKVVSTHSPSVQVEKGSCGGSQVTLGANTATSTNQLLNGSGGVAYNVPANNPNGGQTLPPELDFCFSNTPDGTVVQIQYCITYPGCAPSCATIAITVQNGCQYFSTPGGAGSSCGTPLVISSSSTDVDLDGPNGITNGVPWPSLSDCQDVRSGPSTYPNLDGGTSPWAPRVNMATGIIDTPDDIVCGTCVTHQFQSEPVYLDGDVCEDCVSSASLSVKYSICEQSADKGFYYNVYVTRGVNGPPAGVDALSFRRNGTVVNLGSFPNLFKWDAGLVAYLPSQSVVNSIRDAIVSTMTGNACYKSCVTVAAFTSTDGVGFGLILQIYMCNVCNIKPNSVVLSGVVDTGTPHTCTSHVIPGSGVFAGPSGDCP